jgi:hypothetical protein
VIRVISLRWRRRIAEPRGDDTGSAVIEFLTLGVLMLVPLVYLVITLGRIQAASFAVDGAAREAARIYVGADSEATADSRAMAVTDLALRDQGFPSSARQGPTIRCSLSPCLTPGGQVSVAVGVSVVLPGVPGVVDRFVSLHVIVRSRHTAVVDTFRSRS